MNDLYLNKPYDRSKFVDFTQNFLSGFHHEETSLRVSSNSLFKSAQTLGHALDEELTVIEIIADSTGAGKRIATTKEAFAILRDHGISNALIAFDNGQGEWRLSLLTTTLKLNEKGKVTSEGSNPRRYSYMLGVGAKTVTPYKYLISKGRVEDIKQLQERFSVEVVNKQFYASVADLFTKLVGGERGVTKYPGLLKINGSVSQNVEHQEFAVRLIGRIIFSWFLKEKKSTAGVPIIPSELLSLDAVASNADYYHSILEPLFFELLNRRVENRHESLREAPFSTVPYLNGGLFADQPGDYYNQNSYNGAGTPGLTHIPDGWFTELFTVLEQYNFTVDENTSYDVDLSIDPEMLGRIFENLLAEINPETGESARKSTGSFYTPREIVDYMVDSSLLEFLKGKTGIDDEKLTALISYGTADDELYPLTDGEKEKAVSALANLTILDPACGSGAFPIGILQKIVYILQQADPKAEIWFSKQIANVPSVELRKELEAKFSKGNYDYIRKLGVIKDSIFGVDIQSIATEIAKLRCFLSLVIEEDVDDNSGDTNRGIHPLPNLDFKFVTANSLIPLPQEPEKAQGALFEDTSHIDALRKIRSEYFNANADYRKSLEADFTSIQNDMLMTALDIYKSRDNISRRYDALMSWKPFKHISTDWFDSEWMFGVDGFDIVIANPPYIHLESIKDLAQKLYKPLGFKTYEARGDIYSLFYEKGIESLQEGGILTFITSNKWMRAGYGASLRDFFVQHTNPISLIDLGGGVFESATVDTSIIVVRKEPYTQNTQAVTTSKDFSISNMSDYIRRHAVTMSFKSGESWAILSPIEQSIKQKIEAVGTPLKNWDIKINRGILTGLNEAFIIDQRTRDMLISKDPKSAEIIRPILRGKDIKRNNYIFADKYLICTFPARRYDIDDFPAIRDYLLTFDQRVLAQTGEKSIDGIKGKNARKKTNNKWFETQDSISYWDDFNKRKIVWADIAKEPAFVTIDEPIFFNNTCYMIIGAPKGLADILNSKMIEWYFPKIATDIGNGGARYFKQFVELIRVPNVIEDQEYSDEDVFRLYGLTGAEIAYITSLVAG